MQGDTETLKMFEDKDYIKSVNAKLIVVTSVFCGVAIENCFRVAGFLNDWYGQLHGSKTEPE